GGTPQAWPLVTRLRCAPPPPSTGRPRCGARGVRGKGLTARPAREPRLTGPSPEEVSPSLFEWPRGRERTSIGTGRDALPGTAAPLHGAGPPESACALGEARPRPSGRGPRLLPIASRVAAGPPSPLPAVTQEPRPQRLTVPGRGNYCLLTPRALCGFGRATSPQDRTRAIPAAARRSVPAPAVYASWGICSITQKKKSVAGCSIPNRFSLAAI